MIKYTKTPYIKGTLGGWGGGVGARMAGIFITPLGGSDRYKLFLYDEISNKLEISNFNADFNLLIVTLTYTISICLQRNLP